MKSALAVLNAPPFDEVREIVINGARHLRAGEIARAHGYVRDYVARLCRQGRVRGRRLGKLWYVDTESFAAFVRRNDNPVAQEATPPSGTSRCDASAARTSVFNGIRLR